MFHFFHKVNVVVRENALQENAVAGVKKTNVQIVVHAKRSAETGLR